MSFCFPSRLYAIVSVPDPRGRPAGAVAKAMLDGGARLLQLRWKDAPAGELVAIARQLRELTREAGALFFVNDRADLAALALADGVHLGQDDLPLAEARRLLPAGAWIGASTHDLSQAIAAERAGADYLGFGPLFATETKATGYSARGLERLAAVRAAVRLPIVAIGGIRQDSAASALAAGADAVAMISELVAVDDVRARVRELVDAIDSARLPA
jgi:thiamine-phosphate pyrophosphorylase